MEILTYILVIPIVLALFSGCLWLSMKATSLYAGMPNGGQYCSYTDLLKASTATAIASYIPYIGMVASLIVLYYFLYKYTEAEPSEIIGMVIISHLLAIALFFAASFALPFTTLL